MKRVTSVLLTAGLVGSGLAATAVGSASGATPASPSTARTATVARAAAGYTPPPVVWGPCTGPYADVLTSYGAVCGNLTVPRDYAHPNGAKITLALSKVVHKTATSQGIMLVNPGGPGGSGRVYSVLQSAVPNHGGDGYDWIGFDPRGVGSSNPSLSCNGNYFPYNRPDYVPRTRHLMRFWLHKAAGYSADCKRAGGPLLAHMKTRDWVNDMESIRKEEGQSKLSLYGFSYGSYLGQAYATLHPNRVYRMVLDGVVGWRDAWYKANLNQDVAFDANMHRFFRWIAHHNGVWHLGTSERVVNRKYYAELNRTRRHPLGGKVGPDEWTDAFLSAGYYVYGWNDVASAFRSAVNKHQYKPITDLYAQANGSGPGSDNTFAVYNAVQCTDVQWPLSWAKWKRDNWRIYRKAPFETWANAWYNASCRTWPAKAGHPVRMSGKGVPPVLMVEERYDAATPWAGAQQARRTFGNSRLIEGVRGTTHAGSLSGVACTDDAIARYLAHGTLPKRRKGAADLFCPRVPRPPAKDDSGSLRQASSSAGMPAVLRNLLMHTQVH